MAYEEILKILIAALYGYSKARHVLYYLEKFTQQL